MSTEVEVQGFVVTDMKESKLENRGGKDFSIDFKL